MIEKFIFLLLFIFAVQCKVSAQCACVNCPLSTISNGVVTSVITISGATNNTLGAGGQELIGVYFDFDTDAINEATVRLISPNGSQVLLVESQGINSGQNINFKICFINCAGTPIPDPGFSEIFDSTEDWQDDTNYNGSYYPASADNANGSDCFESLTGSVNGTWVLQIEDNVPFDDGVVNDWFLVFADNTGTTCTDDLGCAIEESCIANGGELSPTTIDACEGDANLVINLTPSYPNGGAPNPALYGYTGVISNSTTGEIIEYNQNPDLTSYAPGSYAVCGLSYLITDLPLIPPANGSYSIDDLELDINNDIFCGNISASCISINILEPPVADLSGPTEICQGQLAQFEIINPDNNTTYDFTVTAGTFSSFTVNGNVLDIVLETGPAQICLEATNICGTANDCIDIDVLPTSPDISITGPTEVCVGEIQTYTFMPFPDNSESYNFTITGGTLAGSSDNIAIITWDDPNVTDGAICVSLIGGPCPGEEFCFPILIQNIVLPTEILVDSPICTGDTSFASVTPSDDVLIYLWELTNLQEIDGNGSSIINFETLNSGIATVCLTMQSVCGNSDPICENIIVLEDPNPVSFLLSPPCNLSFTITSITNPGSIINWSLISGPGDAFINSPNSNLTNVVVTLPGTYELEIQESNNGCVGTSSITVEVFPPLDLNSISFNCDQEQEYTVTLSIVGGMPPYAINGNAIDGNVFTSSEFASGSSYSFSIIDNLGCDIPLISGIYECLCNSESGTMESNSLESCAESGSFVEAAEPADFFLENGDLGLFYLHDNPGNILGNIISVNSTGIFSFEPPIIPGNTYYISYVVGQAQNGEIDLDNPCTSISIGQPVIFYGKPSFILDLPSPICESEFELTIINSNNLESISWQFLDGPSELILNQESDTIYFNSLEPGVYSYEFLFSNTFCDSSFVLDFNVLQDLEITNLNQDCSNDPTFYTLSFEIIGGEGPFTSSVAGVFDNRVFSSELLDPTQDYNVIVTDVNGCETNFTVNAVDCSCDIDIGTILLDTIGLCQGDGLDPSSISLQDYTFDNSIYDLAYYTYESVGSPVDDFIEFSLGAPILQQANYNSGQIYYLRLIISIPNANLDEGLQLNDPCTTTSALVPFTWTADYLFNFDVHPTVCTADSTYSFLQNFPGPFPYTVGFSTMDANEILFVIDEAFEEITLPIFDGAVMWELTYFDGNCDFFFMGNFTITAENPAEFSINSIDTLCNNETFGSVLFLDEMLTPTLEGTWELEGIEQLDNEINFDGFAAGAYQLVFQTNGGSGSCPFISDTVLINIKECDCPTGIANELVFCNSIGIIDPSFFATASTSGIYSINNNAGLANPPVLLSQGELDINQSSPGSYEVTLTLDGTWPASCQTAFTGTLIIQEQRKSGTASENLIICQGAVNSVDLFGLLTDYDLGGNWSSQGQVIESTIQTASFGPGIQTFTYSISSQVPCLSSSTNVNIEILPNPEVEVLSEDVLCFGDSNGSLTIEIFNDINGPYICELDGIEQTEKVLTGLAPGYYNVVVTDIFGCFVEIDSIEIGEPDVVEIDLGNDLEVFYDDSVIISALLTILESDIGSISWEDLNGFIDNDDLTLIKNAIENDQITLTITDANGCVAIDSVAIRLLQSDIQLANVIIPNSNDPLNQRFGMPFIPSISIVDDLRIYDRWGNKVFEVLNVEPGSEEGYWYGNHRNQAAMQGVYSYIMHFTLVTGEEFTLVGDVTLFR